MNYKKGIAVNRFDFRHIGNGLFLDVTHGRDLLPAVTRKALTVSGKTFIGGVRIRRFTDYGVEIKPGLKVDLIRGLLIV